MNRLPLILAAEGAVWGACTLYDVGKDACHGYLKRRDGDPDGRNCSNHHTFLCFCLHIGPIKYFTTTTTT